jgi:hypothetical protein
MKERQIGSINVRNNEVHPKTLGRTGPMQSTMSYRWPWTTYIRRLERIGRTKHMTNSMIRRRRSSVEVGQRFLGDDDDTLARRRIWEMENSGTANGRMAGIREAEMERKEMKKK